MAENITYEKIIQYLSPEKKNNVNFPNKPNLIVYFDEFPNIIKQYFNKNFFRYGVRTHNKDGDNISFWYSVLSILDKYFLTFDKDEQDRKVEYIKQHLYDELHKSGNYHKYEYNLTGLTKSTILEKIKDKVTNLSIQVFCDFFKVNILCINFDDGQKYVYYYGKIFNVYYPCIILSYYNDYYEPILYGKDKKYFTYNDKILEKLIVGVKVSSIASSQKELIIENDVVNIVNDMFKDEIEVNVESEEIEQKIDLDKYQNLTESKLNKKRKDELLDIAKDLQLNLGELQTKTKIQIITQIKTVLKCE